jgi:hypothetical protein
MGSAVSETTICGALDTAGAGALAEGAEGVWVGVLVAGAPVGDSGADSMERAKKAPPATRVTSPSAPPTRSPRESPELGVEGWVCPQEGWVPAINPDWAPPRCSGSMGTVGNEPERSAGTMLGPLQIWVLSWESGFSVLTLGKEPERSRSRWMRLAEMAPCSGEKGTSPVTSSATEERRFSGVFWRQATSTCSRGLGTSGRKVQR